MTLSIRSAVSTKHRGTQHSVAR